MTFTSDTAKREHKRGWKIRLGERQKSVIYLDLCEEMTGKSRKTIIMEFQRNGLKTNDVKDVEIYLRWRVDEIPEKKKEEKEEKKEKVTKQATKVAALIAIQDEAMRAGAQASRPIEVKGIEIKKKEYDPYEDWGTPINK